MLTSEIAAYLGHTDTASTRKWIIKHKLVAVRRDTITGEKLYRRADVVRARALDPGQGARTDLRTQPSAEG